MPWFGVRYDCPKTGNCIYIYKIYKYKYVYKYKFIGEMKTFR